MSSVKQCMKLFKKRSLILPHPVIAGVLVFVPFGIPTLLIMVVSLNGKLFYRYTRMKINKLK